MRILICTLMGLLFCMPLLSQSSLSVPERLKAEAQQDARNEYQRTIASASSGSNSPHAPTSRMLDNDNDWMEDNWEIANGLDPSNPKDAYSDLDGDQLINLHEHYLESDPQDVLSPAVISYTSGDLEEAIELAQAGSVLRIPAGVYPLNYIEFPNGPIKLMIQGGWNEDFSIYDPVAYPTILDGGYFDAVLYISTDDDASSQIIVDGLTIKRGIRTLSGYSNWIINNANSSNFVSFRNCQIVENNGNEAALAIHHWDGGSDRVMIINSAISGNYGSGLKTQTTDSSMVEWRFVNSTISNNINVPSSSREGYGIEGFTISGASLSVGLVNSIVWGNEQESIDFGNGITVAASHSNIGTVHAEIYTPGIGMMDTDPLYVDPAGFDFSLSVGSPCIDQGVDVGLPFQGNSPDIGAFEHGLSSSIETPLQASISCAPNPSRGILSIESSTEVILSLQVYDIFGRSIPATIEQALYHATIQTVYRGLSTLYIETAKGRISKRIMFQ
ncbi:MAG: hypothetical protein AAF587_27745 [Bacteroidota bacterium]